MASKQLKRHFFVAKFTQCNMLHVSLYPIHEKLQKIKKGHSELLTS